MGKVSRERRKVVGSLLLAVRSGVLYVSRGTCYNMVSCYVAAVTEHYRRERKGIPYEENKFLFDLATDHCHDTLPCGGSMGI